MKVRNLLLLFLLLGFLTSCQEEFNKLQDKIDEVKTSEIAPIKSQIDSIKVSIGELEEMDIALKSYIDTLETTAENLRVAINANDAKIDQIAAEIRSELSNAQTNLTGQIALAKTEVLNQLTALRGEMQTQMATVDSTLAVLKAKDTALETQITNLRSYVDTQIGDTRDWASVTFSTLEQYNATVTEIAAIKASITTLNTSLTQMETRLNTKIATDIAAAVSTLEGKLQQSVIDVTSAYTTAIATAKTELTTAYTALATRMDTCEAAIAEISGKIETMQGNISDLQSQMEAVLARIQSVVVIPDYSDGSVACTTGSNQFHFEVLPVGSAAVLAQAPLSSFTMKAVSTLTKSVSFISMPVTAVSAEGNILTVTASGENLGNDFVYGTKSANAALQITVNSTSCSTEYFPLFSPLSVFSLSVSTSNLTPISVNIDGNISNTEGVSEYGICYSKGSPLCETIVQGSGMDAQGNFRVTLNDLVPGKVYYYKAYAVLGGTVAYSEVKSFTSPSLDAYIHTGVVSGVETFSAMLSANVSSEIKGNAGVSYGVCYSTTNANPIITDSKVVSTDADSQGDYSVTLHSLLSETTYYCRAYVSAYGETSYGTVASFTTPKFIIDSDLSANGTANCYIVPASGKYKFRGNVKGNSSTPLDGTPVAAELLWESFGTDVAPSQFEMITGVSYMNDYVVFETASPLKQGNAVIAVKDASNNVLWSWHIWICNGYSPIDLAQTYYNNAGVMMDRNLGATSATPGDVGALGLLYQWGRKDPFLGSSSISSNTVAASTLSWPSAVASNSSNGTIAYAVAHPTTFITYNSSNYDWYYTGSSSADNTRWQSGKTIYDPCPPGWKVPDGGDNGVWSKAVDSSSSFSYTWDSTNKGMNFSGKFGASGTIWYPAAGSLDRDSGSLYDVGGRGRWWSCTPNDYYACGLILNFIGNVFPSSSDYRRACGLSVRCLKE